MQVWALPPPVKLVATARHLYGREFRWHDHSFYELGIVLAGQCDWHLKRRRLSLKAGEVILVQPRTLHCERTRERKGSQLAWVGFDFEGAAPAWSNRVVATEEDFPEIAGYIEILTREHHRADPASLVRVGLAAQSILLLVARRAEQATEVLVSAVRTRSGLNPRQVNSVESAAHYFRMNLANALSVAQVAAYYSLCPAHFSTLFRRHHGRSPRRFLRDVRLERAADLLRTSALTLKEIAALCGYVDAAHLCKTFKEEHGQTPREFRMKSGRAR